MNVNYDDLFSGLDVIGDTDILGAAGDKYGGKKRRHLVLPVSQAVGTTVAGATAANVTNNPQILFVPYRYVIPSDIAGSFDVTQLTLGKDNMFAATGQSMPARVFDERATELGVRFNPLQVNANVQTSVFNTGAGVVRFESAYLGVTLE